MPAIAERTASIAIDLPGFGGSSKPTGVQLRLRALRVRDRRLARGARRRLGRDRGARPRRSGRPALGDRPAAAGDLGRDPQHARLPGVLRGRAAVHPGLHPARAARAAHQPRRARGGDEARPRGRVRSSPTRSLAAVREPFQTDDDRRALADAGIGLRSRASRRSPPAPARSQVPVRVDLRRARPDPAGRGRDDGAGRGDLPQAEVTPLPTAATSSRRRSRSGSATCWLASSPADRPA